MYVTALARAVRPVDHWLAHSAAVMRVGFAPIAWNNEDLKDLRPPVPYTTVLDEVQAAGYTATELGDGFPRHPIQLRRALEARGLALPSAWCGLALLGADTRDADHERTRQLCGVLAEVGASFVNLAHQGCPERRAWAGRADDPGCPRLSKADWDGLAERVDEGARIARTAGLEATFHPHVGTWIETASEVEALLGRLEELKLCWDVGHALYAGTDPVAFVRQHGERIAYLHLKDVDGRVLHGLRDDGAPFEEGIRRRVFTELGRGLLDVRRLLESLQAIGYDDWLMVEQDSTWLSPAESARASRACLHALGV